MTITIHRPIWLRRRTLWLGLAAVLIAVTVAVSQNIRTEPANAATPDVSTAVGAPDSSSYWMRLQMNQDGYLPAAVARSIEERRGRGTPDQYIQDGYLPPAGAAALSESDPNRLSDDRTSGPR